ncbi:MAG: phosphotransferase [Clostridia bacterium]|nr:phosphotransferase [Clostridia bacterium]
MHSGINEILKERFGVVPTSVSEVTGGFSAKAYRVDAGRAYFLKVYDRSLPTMRPFIARIGAYMPALGWLAATPALRGRIAHPIPALDGTYQVQTCDHVFLLFAYIRGETPGGKGLTLRQTEELAETLAILHDTGRHIPFGTPGLTEDISLPFCEKLERYLSETDPEASVLSRLVCPHAAMLRSAIKETVRLRDTVRVGAGPLVLCHADAHPWNVMQSDRLVLVDWEDLRWAPAEADLFMHALSPHWAAFWKAYSAIRSDFRIDAGLMRFYLIRRRLDDMWMDIERITQEDPTEGEVAEMLGWIASSISEARQILSGLVHETVLQ